MEEEQHGGQANVDLQGDQPDTDGGQAKANLPAEDGDQAKADAHRDQPNKVGDQAISSVERPASTSKKEARVTKYSYAYRPTSTQKCLICSHKQLDPLNRITIRHKHFSSKFVRSFYGKNTTTYFCPTCKCMHAKKSTIQSSRVKICISSSTLHEFWAPRGSTTMYEGDINHTEYITIPGAQVLDLLEAWKIDYYDETKPMDIIIVAGLNNIIHDQSPESIMRDYDHFVQVVKHQGHKHHPETKNTCAIATLFYPPQLCWLPGRGPCPPDFNNKYEDMVWLNMQIEKLNKESFIKVPNFPTFGVRKTSYKQRDRSGKVSVVERTTHREEHWREEDPRRMLHLDDARRVKMGRQVGKYFLNNTEP